MKTDLTTAAVPSDMRTIIVRHLSAALAEAWRRQQDRAVHKADAAGGDLTGTDGD